MHQRIKHDLKRHQRRSKPSTEVQDRILKRQKNSCFYCGYEFDEWFVRNKHARKRTPVWDHLSPYAFSFNSSDTNFVASCAICNGIKHSKVFDTVEEAIKHVRNRLVEKGIQPKRLKSKAAYDYFGITTDLFEFFSDETDIKELAPYELEAKLAAIDKLQRELKKIEKANARLK